MDYRVHMQELPAAVKEIPLSMVYNMDETGIFYRMGPNRTYLLQNEDRATVCGTELQKHKSRFTAVFYVNEDGSHALSMRYIGKTRTPKVLQGSKIQSSQQFLHTSM